MIWISLDPIPWAKTVHAKNRKTFWTSWVIKSSISSEQSVRNWSVPWLNWQVEHVQPIASEAAKASQDLVQVLLLQTGWTIAVAWPTLATSSVVLYSTHCQQSPVPTQNGRATPNTSKAPIEWTTCWSCILCLSTESSQDACPRWLNFFDPLSSEFQMHAAVKVVPSSIMSNSPANKCHRLHVSPNMSAKLSGKYLPRIQIHTTPPATM